MKKPTLTIVIAARNEEANIKSLLASLMSQKHVSYSLTNVIVVSDGSTDKTVEIVKRFKWSKLKLFEYRKSLGKSARLRQVYVTLKSDLVVQLDADIRLSNTNFLANLLVSFKDQSVGMTGANSLPATPTTYLGRAIESSTRPYIALRKVSRSLSIGPVLAFRSELAKQIAYPKGIVGEDIFAYFTCLTLGYKYAYAQKAKLSYNLPQSLQEHVIQNIRFLSSPVLMHQYFDAELIEREDYIPKLALFKELLKEFIKHPILASYILMINLYCRLRVRLDHATINKSWSAATSTKTHTL